MKKTFLHCITLALALALLLCACGIEPSALTEATTTEAEQTEPATTQAEQTVGETQSEPDSTLAQFTPEGYLAYPVTTAVSARDQEAIDWMRLYLQKNKASFDLVTGEVLSLENPNWSIGNYGDGFVPSYQEVPNREWEALSKSAQQALNTMDADFRKKFGQDGDICFQVGAVGFIHEDGRRAVHFSWIIFGDDWEELSRFLSYFPDGYANIRPDTPYVDFGDGWHFYSGVNL